MWWTIAVLGCIFLAFAVAFARSKNRERDPWDFEFLRDDFDQG